MRLYTERWLKARVQMEDGCVVPRTAGTPQGGVVSPCLAKKSVPALRLRRVDVREFPDIPFENTSATFRACGIFRPAGIGGASDVKSAFAGV